jgi:hypothetical protein
LNDRDSAGTELAFGAAFTDNHFGTDDTRWGENIDNFQAARFSNPTGGVQTNSEEGAIAIALQTLVEQKFDFLLCEYLGLPVSLYFHLGVYSTDKPKVCRIYCITASVGGIS